MDDEPAYERFLHALAQFATVIASDRRGMIDRPACAPAERNLLTAPLTLPCGAVLPNRIAKAGMTEQLARRDGEPSPRLVTLYRRWAEGGAGLLITGNAIVDGRQPTEPYNVVIDEHVDTTALAAWAAAAKSRGAQVWLQLNHPGRPCAKVSPRSNSARLAAADWKSGSGAMP